MDPSISKRQRRGDPRTTRRDVIEDSADASPSLCARNTVRNMRATAKQRGCEQSVRQKDCEVCSEKKIDHAANG